MNFWEFANENFLLLIALFFVSIYGVVAIIEAVKAPKQRH